MKNNTTLKVDEYQTLLKMDSHIPVPSGHEPFKGKYPLHLLKKAGQSMFFPGDYATKAQLQTAASIYSRKKDTTFKYVTRVEGKGCRIWKI